MVLPYPVPRVLTCVRSRSDRAEKHPRIPPISDRSQPPLELSPTMSVADPAMAECAVLFRPTHGKRGRPCVRQHPPARAPNPRSRAPAQPHSRWMAAPSPCAERDAIDLDRALGRHEGSRGAVHRAGIRRSRRPSGSHREPAHRCGSANASPLPTSPLAMVTKRPDRSPLGKGFAPQLGGRAAARRQDPELEDPGDAGLQIVFRMDGCRCRRSSPARRRPRCGPLLPRLS